MYVIMASAFKSYSFLFYVAAAAAAGILLAFLWNSLLISPTEPTPGEYRILTGASVTLFVGLSAGILSVWNASQNLKSQRNAKLNELRAEAYVSLWEACSLGYRLLSDATATPPEKVRALETQKAFQKAETKTLLVTESISQKFHEFWGEVDEYVAGVADGTAPSGDLLKASVRSMGERLTLLRSEIQSDLSSL